MPITPYLANVLAAMDPVQPTDGQGAYVMAPPPVADPGALVSQAPPAMSAPPPIVGPMPPPEPPPPAASLPTDNPAALVSQTPPQMSQGPAPPIQVGAEPGPAPPAPPAPGPDAHAFDLAPTQAGGAPAHEVEMRGPSLLNAQGHRNASVEGAIGTVDARNQEAVNNEYQVAVSQERLARVRESAYQQSLAEQEDDLATRQADFDTTAKQISKLGQLNPDRLWASKTTAQKIAGGIEIMLAGFRGAPSMVMKKIDEDIRAQEFAYGAARDAANAKQTAFSAAMAKYQNLGAARAMAKAASIDVLQAQLAQVAAKNKGTETGNRAILAMADLDNEKMLQIQNGIRYLPAQAGGRYYVNPKTGLVYNEKEAHEYYAKQQEYSQQERLEGGKVGGQLMLQHDKAASEAEQGGGLGKENAQKLALEQAKGKIERDAILAAIGHGQDNVQAIVKGGYSDDLLAHQPAWAPGATNARSNVSQRESYNNTARLAVAAAYKLSTDATEPKNRALLEEYAGPYVIDAGDNEKSAAHKMRLLRGLVERGAASKGVVPNGQTSVSSAMPGSFGNYAAGQK